MHRDPPDSSVAQGRKAAATPPLCPIPHSLAVGRAHLAPRATACNPRPLTIITSACWPALSRGGRFVWVHSEHPAMLTTNTSHQHRMETGGGDRATLCQGLFYPSSKCSVCRQEQKWIISQKETQQSPGSWMLMLDWLLNSARSHF